MPYYEFYFIQDSSQQNNPSDNTPLIGPLTGKKATSTQNLFIQFLWLLFKITDVFRQAIDQPQGTENKRETSISVPTLWQNIHSTRKLKAPYQTRALGVQHPRGGDV